MGVRQPSEYAKIEKALDWLADDTSPMPEEQIKSRLTKLEVEKRQVETNLAEAKAEQSSKAVMPETFNQLHALINGSIDGNQESRRKIADLVPSIVGNVVIDISHKHFPAFTIRLIDGQEIKWKYEADEIGQHILGTNKDGRFILGEPFATEGHYEAE